MLVLSLLVFVIARLAPGDPLVSYYGERAEKMKPAERAQAEARLGLDQPIAQQYLIWLKGALRGEFGISYKYKMDVLEVIRTRLPYTLRLGGVGFVLLFLVGVVVFQVGFGVIRRANTANLSENANVRTVASALRGGVEWGNGFTQFPEDFSVQEADENTGRIEVTVTDTSSEKALECFAGSQVQATAFAVNALLNPKINTVVYHVNVHMSADGEIERTRLFGFLKPTGDVTSYMTFVWTKTQSANGGVNFGCTITGINDAIQDEIRDQITTSFTPVQILTGK